MNDLEKLRHLLGHWAEHNIEHAEAYRDWAEKMAALGNREAAGALERLHLETKKLQALFDEAADRLR